MKVSITEFCDISDFEYQNIFVEVDQVWQALSRLPQFLTSWFSTIPPEKRLLGRIHPQAVLEGDVFVAAGARVDPCAYIQGPAIVAKNAVIGHSAYLRGNVIVGPDSIVGHSTEVKNSILLTRVWASHFAYIGDSIIGNYTELGAGVKLANFRLDQKTILVSYHNQRFDTKLEKFGAIVADRVSIGCNAVINPGTILGKDTKVYPLTSAVGYYEPKSLVK